MVNRLRIATRTSALALWQAEYVRTQLLQFYPSLKVELLGIKTTGDLSQNDNTPLYKVGGKAVFVKELEQALLAGEADIAVHSLKDVPSTFPEGLGITTFCERDNPFDAWVCPNNHTLASIPAKAKIGTSSLRRMIQLKMIRPDLEYIGIRGNVDTRLRKCHAGEFDAVVLAVAGLKRLNLFQHITKIFSPKEVLPAVGQGALAIECHLENKAVQTLLNPLDHVLTRACVQAERAMNLTLGGNCQVPVAGFATIHDNLIRLKGIVADPKHLRLVSAQKEAPLDQSVKLGEEVAQDLINQGAMDIIKAIMG
ncbi:MAG: hydroxymethylbilane synthase [Proteobacteria bacterium]|nr:hydroxymethylbilane synthase [Pseudomonadota bacterium]